jgi:hypothetical protein
MPIDESDLKTIGCVLLGGIAGAALIQNHHDEAKKSQAEKDDPDGVKELCEIVGDLLQDWCPRWYEREDDYTEDLVEYLDANLDDEIEVELRTSTSRGIPDILIDDRLVLELKVAPSKGERDRLVGQCCDYSREWVTWAIVIDMPKHKVRELEELLKSKSLHYIEVIPFD